MVYIINHGQGDRLLVSATDTQLDTQAAAIATDTTPTAAEATPTTVTWEECMEADRRSGVRVCLQHNKVSMAAGVGQQSTSHALWLSCSQ